MFDPTAFENMKVVIEGALYDLDIIGDIVITDRNDLINLAKMSRQFNICFKLSESKGSSPSAKIIMEANLVNLAAELMPSTLPMNQAGCRVSLQFFLEPVHTIEECREIETVMLDIWGGTRKVTQFIQYNPLYPERRDIYVITLEFDRLIGEEQMEDLVGMTDFVITTLQHLQSDQTGQ